MKKSAEIITVDPVHPEQAFSHCRNVVALGGVIAYPTDTFYGLGVDPRNGLAVKRLFEIKGRQKDQPILLLMADPKNIGEWAAEVPCRAEDFMKRYWPGPLTLIFTAKPDVLPEITAGTGTIGLRVPANTLTRELLGFIGHALTGTSANLAGQPSPCTAHETAEAVGGLVDLILDGGETAGGKPSTVVDASTDTPRLVREGAIPWRDILAQR
ncbi:MAG: L-threonylcarbamoyladenylate synthase [Betaproteobacteria bacterium]